MQFWNWLVITSSYANGITKQQNCETDIGACFEFIIKILESYLTLMGLFRQNLNKSWIAE